MEPDGRLVIVVTPVLARSWDPGTHDPKDTHIFKFKDIASWSKSPEGIIIRFPNSFMFIPMHQILCIDVHMNSDEYTTWKRSQVRAINWALKQKRGQRLAD